MIPILDLKAQYATIRDEVNAAALRVLESQQFILGEEVARFEEACAVYLGVEHAVGVASGSDALALALLALGVSEGEPVVTTPMSYVATAEAIARIGARPVFADVDDHDLNLSPEALEACLRGPGQGARAVIPVHLYGRTCAIERIVEVARAHGAAVVEDAAQAFGAAKGGRKAGTFGELGCYSFFPSKNLGGAGDGGLVTTDSDELGARLRMLRVHGSRTKYLHEAMGLNSRLDALQAAILGVKLPRLDGWNEARRARARAYARALEGVVRLPPFDGDGRYDIFHCHVIRVPDRNALQAHLAEKGIQSAVHYAVPLHLQPCFDDLGYGVGDLPVAVRAADEVLTIPLWPEMSDAQVAEVAGEIRAFMGEA